ncbi:hypothetical protein VTN49DRAFT_4248 [Thermomyces lanuginosus]|uniref:uncharacterized protein n=1 Tax=Thermomyces lanuginosus TaxID=5541 RepID=UPI00374404F1
MPETVSGSWTVSVSMGPFPIISVSNTNPNPSSRESLVRGESDSGGAAFIPQTLVFGALAILFLARIFLSGGVRVTVVRRRGIGL